MNQRWSSGHPGRKIHVGNRMIQDQTRDFFLPMVDPVPLTTIWGRVSQGRQSCTLLFRRKWGKYHRR